MATKRRKTKSRRRKSRRKSCKYGKLKRPIKTKSGRKRRCKKKSKKKTKRRRKRKYRMMSLRDMSRDSIRRSGMLQNIPGRYERRREVIRSLPNEQSMLLEGLMPAQLSDMPDEILLNIFENSNFDELSNLYKTNERMRGIVVDIIRRKYTQEEKDNYLIGASLGGDTKIVKMLLDAGANVNAPGGYFGDTALLNVSRIGHTEIVRMLIQRGADMNAQNREGYTALMYASDRGHTEIVRMLIQRGADVNAKTIYDRTALMEASYRGLTEIVRMLIYAGANVNIRNQSGYTALTYAISDGYGNTEVLELLRDAGARL